jgi:hypothetical protein
MRSLALEPANMSQYLQVLPWQSIPMASDADGRLCNGDGRNEQLTTPYYRTGPADLTHAFHKMAFMSTKTSINSGMYHCLDFDSPVSSGEDPCCQVRNGQHFGFEFSEWLTYIGSEYEKARFQLFQYSEKQYEENSHQGPRLSARSRPIQEPA